MPCLWYTGHPTRRPLCTALPAGMCMPAKDALSHLTLGLELDRRYYPLVSRQAPAPADSAAAGPGRVLTAAWHVTAKGAQRCDEQSCYHRGSCVLSALQRLRCTPLPTAASIPAGKEGRRAAVGKGDGTLWRAPIHLLLARQVRSPGGRCSPLPAPVCILARPAAEYTCHT